MRGIRGAITVEQDEKADIWQAAAEMVTAMLEENGITPEDIGAAIFSQTEDLVIAIEGSIPMCIRALLLVDTDRAQRDIHHIYLGRAKKLRPDLAK